MKWAGILIAASLIAVGSCKEHKRNACIRVCATATKETQAGCAKIRPEHEADACYETEAKRSLRCLQKCL